ncbi:sortase domain-bontaining protein [Humibacillus xanthopallidus]|uniref:sortase domain-containing protein n=1 Tax=Humibacillus xanthopallidus TaxID=412689 RepID=UPI00384AD013
MRHGQAVTGSSTPSAPRALGAFGAALLCLVMLLAACSGQGTTTAAGLRQEPSGIPGGAASSTVGTTPSVAASPAPSRPASIEPASAIKPVARGELTHFTASRGRRTIVDAASSGLARYNRSPTCEVPGQPCYDAPYLDRVARIDLGGPPMVPGTQTTFVTGHANRFHPDDPSRGVLTRLQEVRIGDTLVLTTTRGRFIYAVTEVLTVPFDKLTSHPAVVTVRPDTVVAISCVIAPDRRSYTGNYVVIGTLTASSPA